jgi:YD repeat-containing protein
MSNDNDVRPFDEPDGESRAIPVAPEPASASPAVPCPDCRGSGRIVLLTSSRACARCGGSGRLDAAAGTRQGSGDPNSQRPAARAHLDAAAGRTPKRPVEESDREVIRTFTYDVDGRLTSVTDARQPCRGEVTVWRYGRDGGREWWKIRAVRFHREAGKR